jgi:hypothetical protein
MVSFCCLRVTSRANALRLSKRENGSRFSGSCPIRPPTERRARNRPADRFRTALPCAARPAWRSGSPGPRLQPRKRKLRTQAECPDPRCGPSLDRRGDAGFRIEMVDENDPPAGFDHVPRRVLQDGIPNRDLGLTVSKARPQRRRDHKNRIERRSVFAVMNVHKSALSDKFRNKQLALFPFCPYQGLAVASCEAAVAGGINTKTTA